jgi:large subunit ribosomal protein L30
MALLLVVNLHGKINSSDGVRKALGELKVERKFSASVVTDDPQTVGTLKSCKEYIAWTSLEKDVLVSLLQKRGMISESRRLDEKTLTDLGYKSYEDLADRMLSNGLRLSAIDGLRPFFRLSPPRGGFKASLRRQASQRGTLGKNPKLADVVRRMV